MSHLLKENAKLVGVFFNRIFEGGPPFSGSKEEYQLLFKEKFEIKIMDECYNSIGPRRGLELFVMLQKL